MRFVQILIRGYQLFLSPIIHSVVPVQGGCRFHPTCSSYAKEAVGQHGIFFGSWLMLKRVSRCHPWSKAGYDPVPEPHHDSHCETHFNR